jgi:RNA polymerase sigma factor (sigma-70 family)
MTKAQPWPVGSLVESARRGDAASIEALVVNSYPHVQRFARSLCSTPSDAEDAAQEALVVLYRRIGTLRATAAFSSWMFRVVRSECIRRTRVLRRRPEESLVDDRALVDSESTEHDVLGRLEAARIAQAIASLPADQRSVLIMRDVQDRPGHEVARELGLSTAAMKSRLHRARLTLREVLDAT